MNSFTASYKMLPLSVRRKYSGTLSYCRHTHLKLVMSDHFSRTRMNGAAVLSEHPVFNLSLHDLINLWVRESLTTEEKYITSTALLVKINAIDTTGKDCCGLHMEDSEYEQYEQIFHELVVSYGYQLVTHMHWNLTSLRITPEIASSGKRIKHHIENIIEQIQSLLLEEGISQQLSRRSCNGSEDLDDAVEFEAQLRKTLQQYNKRTYTNKLGQWAIRQLQALSHDTISSDEIEVVQFCLNAPDIKLRDTLLKQSIELLKANLDFMHNDSRNKAVLVVRYLQHKLESIYKEAEEMGFIILDTDIEAGRGTGVNYTTKTRIKSDIQLKLKKAKQDATVNGTTTKPLSSTANDLLARIRNRK